MMNIDERIEEINKRLVLSQDASYYPDKAKYGLSEKEHLELWDEMWEMMKKKKGLK